MVDTFRVFGGELGEVEGYLDVEVQGVARGGTVILADMNSTAEYSIDIERLEGLVDQSLAYDLDTVETAKEVWSAIDSLEQSYVDSQASDKSHFIDAAKTLFRGAQ